MLNYDQDLKESLKDCPQLTKDVIYVNGAFVQVPSSPASSMIETPAHSSCFSEDPYLTSSPQEPDSDFQYPMYDQSYNHRIRIHAAISGRPHKLLKHQVEAIANFLIHTDSDVTTLLNATLANVVREASPTEHTILMHTLAAAAAFHEAILLQRKLPQTKCPPTAIEHYSSATDLLPFLHPPSFHFDLLYRLLDIVKCMAHCFL